MATLNLPAWGYGIRYTYGMFRQVGENGGRGESLGQDAWVIDWEVMVMMRGDDDGFDRSMEDAAADRKG